MSFGFDRHTPGMSCITDEIRYATFMKTVLFAAAHNDGGRKEIAYPANHSDVICINSTNGDGTPSSFNPSPKKGKNFSTLGEGVPLHSDITNRKSGTSYATPIAAGIAAVVMDYMVRKSKSWSEERRSVVELIKTRDGIVAVFDKHFSDKRSDFKYLFPWKFFRRGAIGLDMVLLNTLQSI